MERDSRDILRKLLRDGWRLNRIKGSDHQFRKEGVAYVITLPHPKRDLAVGLVRDIYKKAGWPLDE